MKQTILFLFLLNTAFLPAQEKSDSLPAKERFRFGFSTAVTYISEMNESFYLPSLTIENSKHQFTAGPLILSARYSGQAGGLECSYRYYPNTSKNRFNLYLLADASYFKYYDSRTFESTVYTYNSNIPLMTVDEVRSSWSSSNLKFGAGYGIRLKVTRWWYFYQHNSIGVLCSGGESSSRYRTYTQYNKSYHTSMFSDPNFCFQVSFGTGFQF